MAALDATRIGGGGGAFGTGGGGGAAITVLDAVRNGDGNGCIVAGLILITSPALPSIILTVHRPVISLKGFSTTAMQPLSSGRAFRPMIRTRDPMDKSTGDAGLGAGGGGGMPKLLVRRDKSVGASSSTFELSSELELVSRLAKG